MIEKKRSIFVDGMEVTVNYCEINGHLMVPALFFKFAGILVDSDSEHRTVFLTHKEKTITFYIDQYDVVIKGEHKTSENLEVAPFLLQNKIYIPFLYTIEKLLIKTIICPNTEKIEVMTIDHFKFIQKMVYKKKTNQKVISLTFDDGPDAIYTPQILEVLKEKNIRATFFVIGQQVKKHPEILKRIVNEGHAIGNHSWSHVDFTKLTASQLRKEIKLTEAELINHVGEATTILRPPFGNFTKVDFHIIDNLGYKVIMWSINTLDWLGLNCEQIISIVERDLSEGAIMLQHCIGTPGKFDSTVKALPIIIDKLTDEGYKILTIPKLLE
jgi:peptidoglycan-N-acetylglucosamine deacetylase